MTADKLAEPEGENFYLHYKRVKKNSIESYLGTNIQIKISWIKEIFMKQWVSGKQWNWSSLQIIRWNVTLRTKKGISKYKLNEFFNWMLKN